MAMSMMKVKQSFDNYPPPPPSSLSYCLRKQSPAGKKSQHLKLEIIKVLFLFVTSSQTFSDTCPRRRSLGQCSHSRPC